MVWFLAWGFSGGVMKLSTRVAVLWGFKLDLEDPLARWLTVWRKNCNHIVVSRGLSSLLSSGSRSQFFTTSVSPEDCVSVMTWQLSSCGLSGEGERKENILIIFVKYSWKPYAVIFAFISAIHETLFFSCLSCNLRQPPHQTADSSCAQNPMCPEVKGGHRFLATVHYTRSGFHLFLLDFSPTSTVCLWYSVIMSRHHQIRGHVARFL